MADKKTKKQKYDDLLKAMSEGEIGMTKFLWDLIESIDGSTDKFGTKLEETQKHIDAALKSFEKIQKAKNGDPGKPGVDGKTPSNELLIALINSLIPQLKDGKTPTRSELLDIIEPLIPDPIPGQPGPPGSPGRRGLSGRVPRHEWNGTFIRFENSDGSWGEWKNLQGPAGVSESGGIGSPFELPLKAGSNITIRKDASGAQIISSDAAASSSDPLTPTGNVGLGNTNKTFTVTATPKYIVLDGTTFRENFGYTLSGTTLTTDNPPQFDIFYFI